METYTIVFQPFGRQASVSGNTTLLDAARQAGIPLRSSCGGEGTCGKCRVVVRKGRVDASPSAALTDAELEQGYVLACQARPLEDLEVEVPAEARIEDAQAAADSTTSIAYNGPSDVQVKDAEGPAGTLRPVVQQVDVELSPPTLDDTVDDLQRLIQASGKATVCPRSPIRIGELRKLPRLLRSHDWRASAYFSEASCTSEIVRVEAPGHGSNLGLAIDVGTTTVVAQLVDLSTGEVMGTKGAMNRQGAYGDDVISRIVQACQFNQHLALNRVVIANINALASALCEERDQRLSDINAVACAGNATMIHLLLGLPPCSIRLEPFVPATNVPPVVRAWDLGIEVYPEAPVLAVPGVSGFVGGDIVAGILAVGMDQSEETVALIDIGTNGEIAIGNRDWMVSCASSAGPAFEGSGIVSGVRAIEGAIQSVEIHPQTRALSCRTVGNKPPLGLCGSGLVDLMAELFLRGMLDRSGRFHRLDADPRLSPGSDYGPEFLVVPAHESASGRPIVLTEVDVRNLIRSKGAIFTALMILVDKVGMSLSDIRKFYVAGGFGAHLDIPHAITIGLLPDLPVERFEFVGNTSLLGARRALLSTEDLARAHQSCPEHELLRAQRRPRLHGSLRCFALPASHRHQPLPVSRRIAGTPPWSPISRESFVPS